VLGLKNSIIEELTKIADCKQMDSFRLVVEDSNLSMIRTSLEKYCRLDIETANADGSQREFYTKHAQPVRIVKEHKRVGSYSGDQPYVIFTEEHTANITPSKQGPLVINRDRSPGSPFNRNNEQINVRFNKTNQKQELNQKIDMENSRKLQGTGNRQDSLGKSNVASALPITVPDFCYLSDRNFEVQGEMMGPYLHFFQNDQKYLHIVPVESILKAENKISSNEYLTVTLNNQFQIPFFHKSIMTPTGKLFLIGGTSQGKKIGDIYEFQGDRLVSVAQLIKPRSSHAICYMNNSVYIVGGITETGEYLSSLERFDTEKYTLEQLTACNRG
jgi:hypothetical protein